MISDVYIFQFTFEHLLVSIGQVSQNFVFHLITLFQVASTELASMLHFKNFEAETDVVLLNELAPLAIFVESGSTELLTPPRSVVLPCGPNISSCVGIMDDLLVVISFTEAPN